MNFLRENAPVPEFRNSFLDWLIALGITAAWIVALVVIRRLIRLYHRRLLKTPDITFIQVFTATLGRTSLLFIVIAAVEAGLSTLNPSAVIARAARSAVMIVLLWQVGVWSTAATDALLERHRLHAVETDRALAGSLSIIGAIVRTVIWIVVALLILQNAGVDVSALLAGLGIGGVAVALSVQNILGDLFASLSITLDRPFLVGDLLFLENCAGRVEHIGLKSTRVRSLGGEQIIVSNADLLKTRLRNFGRMHERLVEFTLGLAYDTSSDILERVPSIIRDIVRAQQDTRFDRSYLARHGVHSLDFETAYFVLTPDFNRHLEIQHCVQVEIHRAFAREGIRFAEPPARLLSS